jgi:hypothetical protein
LIVTLPLTCKFSAPSWDFNDNTAINLIRPLKTNPENAMSTKTLSKHTAATFALRLTSAAVLVAAACASASHAADLSGIYTGRLGHEEPVLLELTAAGATAPLQGQYHFTRRVTPDFISVQAQSSDKQRVTMTEAGGARFTGRADANYERIAGTWLSDDEVKPFTLERAGDWEQIKVKVDGGTRECRMPKLRDARYAEANREFTEACDAFVADGRTPGRLDISLDSLGRYIVAAVLRFNENGVEEPPEVIAIDVGGSESAHESQAAAPSIHARR